MFKLRIKPSVVVKHHRSAADDKILHRQETLRQEQLKDAVEYCNENACKGYTAIKTGQFPVIKDPRTINRRLMSTPQCRRITTGNEKEHLRLLTMHEETCLVKYIKNRNRACGGMTKKEIDTIIIDMLKVRNHINKSATGKKYIKLSENAKHVLAKNKVGRGFWRRFHATYPDIVRKHPGTVSINRALNCTREMAANYLDELAAELIEAGIFEDAVRREPGVWRGKIDTSRIIGHDETPQFINYGIDKTANGFVFCGKGDACHKLIKENRECVTIQPFSTFSGEIILCQVIFAGTGITSHMAPAVAVDSIKNLFISTTPNGVSKHKSLLGAYKRVDQYLKMTNIKRPVVIISDGHSSRCDADVLKFLFDYLMRLFLLPPDTTGVTQKHDQINQNIHKEYRDAKEEMFTPFSNINHEGFMTILSKAWPNWVAKEDLVAAARKVGISKDGLDVNWMDQKTFARAKGIMKSPEKGVAPPSTVRVPSPVGERSGSNQYLRLKLREAERMLNEQRAPDAGDVPGLLSIAKPKPKPASTKNVRVTQMHGSMTGKDALALATEVKNKKLEKERRKIETQKKKKHQMELYYRCRDSCTCDDSGKCVAIRLRECSVCERILLSQCNRCRSPGGGKAKMNLPAAATSISTASKRKVRKQLFCEEPSTTDSDSTDEEFEGDNEEENTEDGKGSVVDIDDVIAVGSYVRITQGMYKGEFATVKAKSYGDEYEIQFFEEKMDRKYGKHWVLKDNHLDSRLASEMENVDPEMDWAGRFVFN